MVTSSHHTFCFQMTCLFFDAHKIKYKDTQGKFKQEGTENDSDLLPSMSPNFLFYGTDECSQYTHKCKKKTRISHGETSRARTHMPPHASSPTMMMPCYIQWKHVKGKVDHVLETIFFDSLTTGISHQGNEFARFFCPFPLDFLSSGENLS